MAEFKLSWLLALAGIILIFLLVKSFLTAIAFAAVVAFLLLPTHSKLRRKIPESASAALLTLITAAVIIFAVLAGASTMLNEFGKIYLVFSKIDVSKLISSSPELSATLRDVVRFFLSKIIGALSELAAKIPHVILSLMIFFITLFFFIKDGEKLYNWIKARLPLNHKRKDIFKDITNYAHAFINVWLLIGFLQAVVALFGFFLFGLPYALLGAIAAGILSVLPIIGPYALYLPIGAYIILSGDTTIGLSFIAYGLILGSILDYGLRPYLAGKWSEVHPLIVLLGIFGGLSLFGPAGFIIGPMLLMIIAAFFKEYGKDKIFKS